MREKRNLATRVILVFVLCVALALVGCSTAWISQAEQIVAALIPAAANIVALVAALQSGSVSAQDMQAIQSAGTQATADLQLIQSLVTAYQKADATAQPGLLNQIQAAIGTTQSNLSALLLSLHIKDAATEAKVTAIVGVVLSEVQSLGAVVPLVGAGGATHSLSKDSVRAPAKGVSRATHPQIPLTAGEFVASYNATMTAKTGKADVDQATSGLRIHVHGKLERLATGGVLK